jgi:hypothetical protein
MAFIENLVLTLRAGQLPEFGYWRDPWRPYWRLRLPLPG